MCVCLCSQNSDELVVGVRNDYLLHCYDISTGRLVKVSHEENLLQLFSLVDVTVHP